MGYTKEQLMAINTEGTSIIVSAGAGSGKTAVLTERVIRKLKSGIDIDKLLILTFTNEAANEMKSRIRASIIKNKLDNQLELLDSAYITTFDSFALSIVKKYHYILNIDKNIKIVDSNVIKIYKYRQLDNMFESMYGNNKFNNMISDYCLKDDKVLKDFIINCSNSLDLLIDKEEYLENYIHTHFSNKYLNNIIKEYNSIIKCKINELNIIYKEFSNYANDNLIKKIDDWFKPLFNGNKYDEFIIFKKMASVKLIGIPEEGNKLKENLKDKVKEITTLLKYDNEKEIISSLSTTKPHIEVIIDIIKKLDIIIKEYKDKHGVYEFNDISHMAIKIVHNDETIREEIKNYFNEIMVDEYQDTSSLQEAFIKYISNNNVYMVGDIKQSIYRFRNANPYIFKEKYDAYGKKDGGIKIDLLKNFRSRKEVLANINEIFNLIMDDEIGGANYLKEHNMIYGNTLYDSSSTGTNNNLEVYNYRVLDTEECTKEEKEIFIIAKDIKEKILNKYQVFDKKSSKLRNLRYDDICIITDRNKHLDLYKKVLEYHMIPSVIYTNSSLNGNMVFMVMKNLIGLVTLISKKEYNDQCKYYFTSIARSYLFNYDDNKIYHIIKENKYYETEIILKCQKIDMNKPTINIINQIIDEFEVYHKLTIIPNIEANLIQIDSIINMANNLSLLGYSISEFITYLDDMINLNLPIEYTLNQSNENAVKIMNIHKSKGLEFSLCYYTGMHNKFRFSDISTKYLISSQYGFILPYIKENRLEDTILKEMYINDYYKEEISEKIRLLYVALTRCREKMIILANLDENQDGYNSLVPASTRLKYRTFLDILNSLRIIDKYIVEKDSKYTKEYKKTILRDIEKNQTNIIINKKSLNINYQELKKEHFSKKETKLIDKNTALLLDEGTKIHEILEYEDFKTSTNQYVVNLMGKIDKNYQNIYHEYEFLYQEDNIDYHGIIDLILEYEEKFVIIDYKFKSITDSEYEKQLKGYKNYLAKITDKKITTYLYSIYDNEMKEIV